MKLLSLFLALVLVFTRNGYATAVNANPPSGIEDAVFELDEDELSGILADFVWLERLLEDNGTLTFQDIQFTDDLLASGFNHPVALMGMTDPEDKGSNAPLGIPSFLWGCTLGWAGILMAYLFSDKDKDEAKKALWGCITTGGIVVVIYLAISVLTLTYYPEYGY